MAEATFLALSKFKVRNGMEADVRAAFLARPHLVDRAEGFIRMDVVSPTGDDSEFWLLTWWRDEATFPGLASQPSLSRLARGHPARAQARPRGD